MIALTVENAELVSGEDFRVAYVYDGTASFVENAHYSQGTAAEHAALVRRIKAAGWTPTEYGTASDHWYVKATNRY